MVRTPKADIHPVLPRCQLYSPDETLTVRVHVWVLEA